MADAVILRLAQQDQLLVLPTSSIFKYTKRDGDARAIGRELGVDAVLDGTIQRSGDRLRVTAHLIRVADGTTLWTGKFDQDLTDIFVVQDSVSAQLAHALPLTVTNHDKQLKKHYTQNAEAYELYTLGLYFWNKRTAEGLTKAVDYFTQAIDKDPNFALAHASLADSYMLIGHYGYGMTRQQVLPKVKASALRAIELDPNLAEAHAAMGVVNGLEGNYPEAIKLYERAIELNPNLATTHLRYGYLLANMGRLDDAIHHMQRAHALDPLSSTVDVNLSAYYGFKRNYDESIKYARMALEVNPEAWEARVNLGEILEAKGVYQEAEAEYRKLEQAGKVLEAKQQLAYFYAVTGKTSEAWKLLRELEKAHEERKAPTTTAHNIALVYVGLGKHDEAFAWLNKAFDSRALVRTDFEYGHKLDPLRSDPRFRALRERIYEGLRQHQEALARARRQNLK
jgi:tetratricopeptide (TPR) repeat protein